MESRNGSTVVGSSGPVPKTKRVVRVNFGDREEIRKDPVWPPKGLPGLFKGWCAMPLIVMIINGMTVTKMVSKK